jgi:release factor glutamine methyltransferase
LSKGPHPSPDMEYLKEIEIRECPLVYPPMEDTFLLLGSLQPRAGERALEMGCGTGLISCHLAAAGIELTAADINPHAAECTMENLRRNGLIGVVKESDLFDSVGGMFDLIVFNPPYLAAHEEGILEKAWAGGEGGLETLRPFLAQAKDHLLPGGRIVVLLSSEMDRDGLDLLLRSYERKRLAARRLFFEELWVERLVPR